MLLSLGGVIVRTERVRWRHQGQATQSSHSLPNAYSWEDWHSVKATKSLILLARPKRFELLTPRFVVWCSIQLSYGRGAS